MVLAATRLDRFGFGGGLLAVELDFAGRANVLFVLSALARIRSGCRCARRGAIWTRSRRDFVLLFLISAPVWWVFELINLRTGNWEYVGRELFTPLQFD